MGNHRAPALHFSFSASTTEQKNVIAAGMNSDLDLDWDISRRNTALLMAEGLSYTVHLTANVIT